MGDASGGPDRGPTRVISFAGAGAALCRRWLVVDTCSGASVRVENQLGAKRVNRQPRTCRGVDPFGPCRARWKEGTLSSVAGPVRKTREERREQALAAAREEFVRAGVTLADDVPAPDFLLDEIDAELDEAEFELDLAAGRPSGPTRCSSSSRGRATRSHRGRGSRLANGSSPATWRRRTG